MEYAHPYCALAAPIDKRWFLINQRVVEKLRCNVSHIFQDELDLAEIALTPKERADILLHRQLDNEVEKSKIFATPILNIGRCVYRPAAVEEVLGA